MGTLSSGGQPAKRECLQPLTVNTSCVEPEVVAVKVEVDYTNVVNTVLFFFLILTVYIQSDTVCILGLLSYSLVFDGNLGARMSQLASLLMLKPIGPNHEQLLRTLRTLTMVLVMLIL